MSGSRDLALGWYLDAEKLYEKQHNTKGLITVYDDLCVLYLKEKKIQPAIEVINRAIILADSIHNPGQKANGCNNKGLIFYDTKKYDSARYFFKLARDIYQAIKDDVGMAYSLSYLASAYADGGEPDAALAYLQESNLLFAKHGDKYGEAVGINNVGELLLQQHKYAMALPYFKEASEKANKMKFYDLEDNTYKMMTQIYKELGDYKSAFDAAQKEKSVHEKIVNDHQLKTIEELQTKYETRKKEEQNKLLTQKTLLQESQLSRNRILTYSLLSLSLLTIGLLYLFYNRYRLKQNAKFKEEQFDHEKQRASAVVDAGENERQRLARELHDGVGQLLAATRRKIDSLPRPDAATDAAFTESVSLLDDSIKEVRQLSHNMMPPWLRNKPLQQAIEELVSQVTQSTKIKIGTEWINTAALELEKMQVLMLYRSMQEILSNVVRHAEATTVNIEVVNHDDELNILVYDDGKGFDAGAVMKNGSGIGLKNIKSRIEYIGGQLEIDSHPGKGTTYIIYLPLIKNA